MRKRSNTERSRFVCPNCNHDYSAGQEELDHFEEFECPFCLSDVPFEGNEEED